MTSPSFYSYLWLRENGTPFYVGKGSGRRAYWRHRKIFSAPKDHTRIVIFPMESEALAFESEIALIQLFGRKDNGTGILRNLTDGGENPPKPTEELRRRFSVLRKGKPLSEETRRKISKAGKGRKLSEKECRERSERVRANWGKTRFGQGQPMSEQHRQIVSKAKKGNKDWLGRKHSIETRRKMSEALKGNTRWIGRKHSEETRRKMSETAKKIRQREHICVEQLLLY